MPGQAPGCDRHEVEANGAGRELGPLLQKSLGRPRDTGLLQRQECCRGVGDAGASLDLHEHQCSTAPSDQVNLADMGNETAREDAVTTQSQMPSGGDLGHPAGTLSPLPAQSESRTSVNARR